MTFLLQIKLYDTIMIVGFLYVPNRSSVNMLNSSTIDMQPNISPLVSIDSLHPPIDVNFIYNNIVKLLFQEYVYNWNLGDYKLTLNYLGEIDFYHYFNNNSTNNSIDFTYNHIYHSIHLFIPLKSISKSSFTI